MALALAKKHLPYVFDRFYRVNEQEGSGTGIGLALTKELVQLLQGHITAKSKLEQGTVFTLTLPITRNAPKYTVSTPITLQTNTETAPKDQFILYQERPLLLIVEDNIDVMTYIKGMLASDYQLLFAQNGKQGLEKAFEYIPDLVLSDVMMPIMDGFEMTHRLKTDERTSHIPIILLTAKADMPSKLKGLEFGADAYLAKPFNKKELFIRLRKLLELRRQLQTRYQSLQPSQHKSLKIEDAFLQKLRNIVETHLSDENFAVPELCDALYISRSQLHRKLKALTGRSTSHVVRSIRLQRAKQLLETTKMNISEVAYAVGFKEPAFFSKVFKEEFGVPPSQVK